MSPKPHAVCIPFPAQGHIHATLKLAKLLHSKGFHITFVHTEFNYNRILASGDPSALRSLEDFRFETIPDGLPLSGLAANQDINALWAAVNGEFAIPFLSLLTRLNRNSGVPPVTCIVSDVITCFTIDVAEECGVPVALFCSVSAAAHMAFLKHVELVDTGIMPVNGEIKVGDKDLDIAVDWLPGKKIKTNYLLTFPPETDPNGLKFNLLKHQLIRQAPRASAVILNTFDELEGEALDKMAPLLPPIYTVGPLAALCHDNLNKSSQAVGPNNLWQQDSSCLEWLDERAPCSVMYLNIGSEAVMTRQQLVELAWGLFDCGHDFLWVIRPGSVTGDFDALPREFLEGTEGRGLLTSWCPQERVLTHPSVGGFLTHCGWNSMTESIVAGVPMLCWPCFGDQYTNCFCACNEWGIGMEIDKDVKRENMATVIRELMGGNKGREMKRRALKWKETALEATKRGGRSLYNLERVINEVLLKNKK